MVTAKVWTMNNNPGGLPSETDFKCIEEKLPECTEGGIIIEAEFLSVDPYMRYRLRQTEIGTVITGSQVARVIASKNEEFPVGSYVVGYPGWRTHTSLSKEDLKSSSPPYIKVPFDDLPRSTALGVLGMPGNTAYFGLLEICQPKAGDTVLVNGAAGAVGSYVCQIAKIKGCKVIAFAGADDKVEWLKTLGVDHAYNYKSISVTEALKESATNGINCYFDNVGGKFTAEALPFMAEFGKIAACGAISTYNDERKDIGAISMTSPFNEGTLIWKKLRVEGFIVYQWTDRWFEGLKQLRAWIKEGKLKYKETVTEGFENMPKAFLDLFHGNNTGKAIVKV